jgi:polyketide biosynthesis enoyl-CoA hydratase PksI
MSALVRFVPGVDGVGTIEMADAKGNNAMTSAWVEAFAEAVHMAVKWPELKVVLLVGTPEVFSSGANMEMLSAIVSGAVLPTEIVLPKLVLDIPVPVVAAMEGHAIGGGLAIGLCADIIVLARESRYGASFMNMGFTPGMGTTRLLEHVLSPAIVAELLFTGEPKKGSFFEGKSGINAVLPRDDVREHATRIAERIAEKPRLSLELLKRTLSLPRRQAFEATHTLESLMHRVTFAAPDVLERIKENN